MKGKDNVVWIQNNNNKNLLKGLTVLLPGNLQIPHNCSQD